MAWPMSPLVAPGLTPEPPPGDRLREAHAPEDLDGFGERRDREACVLDRVLERVDAQVVLGARHEVELGRGGAERIHLSLDLQPRERPPGDRGHRLELVVHQRFVVAALRRRARLDVAGDRAPVPLDRRGQVAAGEAEHRLEERLHAPVPLVEPARERSIEDVGELAGHALDERGDAGHGLVREEPAHDVHEVRRVEGRRAMEQLEEDDSRRPHVGLHADLLVFLLLAPRLLGRHVAQRADEPFAARGGAQRHRVGGEGDAEVDELGRAAAERRLGEEDVVGLDVPVDHAHPRWASMTAPMMRGSATSSASS